MGFKSVGKKLLIIPAILLGVFVVMSLVKSKKTPEQGNVAERTTAVRTITAQALPVIPRALGYGNVEPDSTWQGVAEVGGKIVEINPELKNGAILPKGELLFRVDPAEYGLAASRDQAEVENVEAQLRELAQREANYQVKLEVERRSLEISGQELERRRKLVAQGTISRSEVDQEEKMYLTQKQAVTELENQLKLLKPEREKLLASLSSGQSRLADTQLDIEKTTIRAPFTLRVTDVNAELMQYVATGQVLVEAYDIGVAVIPAQFQLGDLRYVMGKAPKGMTGPESFSMEKLREMVDVDAKVRLPLGEGDLEWDARFERIGEQIDPQTRTVAVYVAVDEPYRDAQPGVRPPLVKNMYCEVELWGKPRGEHVVLPRSAVHQNGAYVVDKDNRLKFQPVDIEREQGDLAIVKEGVKPGETVVVSDLTPAIEGMLLAPQKDADLESELAVEASGEGSLK